MINDNYVTGDNIYLRELQNFFFEVLGMMSITHYGAIGDGRTDNYGPIQVAIDDANRRGLSFLYVPYGKFIYTGEFTNLIDPDTGKQRIIFMGNPHAHIVNIRTGEEIEIKQFGWCDCEGGEKPGVIDEGDIELVDGQDISLEKGKTYRIKSLTVNGVQDYDFSQSIVVVSTPRDSQSDIATMVSCLASHNMALGDTQENPYIIKIYLYRNGVWELASYSRPIVSVIDSNANDNQIPTAKAVKDYVDSIVPQEGEYRFMSFIAPTHWDTTVSAYKEYTTTDGYGLWRAYADSSAGSDWIVSNLFDGNDSTSWKSDDVSVGETVSVGINFPVLIKPTELRVMPAHALASQPEWPVVVQFQNADDTWDTIWSFNLPNSQTPTELVEEVSPNKWYKAFRAVLTRPSGGTSQKALASLEVTKGYWKEA